MPETRRLRPEEETLLRRVVSRRLPSLLRRIETLGVEPLNEQEKSLLWDAISDELIETGLRPDDEPNERGIILDDLIDRIGSL